MKLLQHLPAGLREGHGRYQADALRHVQRVAADVVRVEALQAGDGGCGVEHGAMVGQVVPLLLEPPVVRWECAGCRTALHCACGKESAWHCRSAYWSPPRRR